MEKKFSWLLAIIISTMSFAMTSCGDDDENSTGKETYYYYGEYKNTLIVRTDWAEVYFYPENEDAIREELSRHKLSLGEVSKYLETNRLDQYTEAGQNLLGNLMRGTINGDYRKYKSALKHTVAWSPHYEMPYLCVAPRPSMSFAAQSRPGVEHQQIVRLAEENGVIITYMNDTYDPSTIGYVFACTNESKDNAVEMSVIFHECGLFEGATPLFGTIHDME